MPELRPQQPGPGAGGGAGRRAPSVTVREQKRSGTCTVSVAAGSAAAAPRGRPTWAMPGARGVSWVSGRSHTAALWRAEAFKQRPALPKCGQGAASWAGQRTEPVVQVFDKEERVALGAARPAHLAAPQSKAGTHIHTLRLETFQHPQLKPASAVAAPVS